MATPSAETLIKVASDAAQTFVDTYYPALNSQLHHAFSGGHHHHGGQSGRQSLAAFYTSSCRAYVSASPSSAPPGDAKQSEPAPPEHPTFLPSITANGARVATPQAYASLVAGQGSGTRYEVRSFDAQVVNPRWAGGLPSPADQGGDQQQAAMLAQLDRRGGRMSLLVTVTGTVTFGPRTVVPKPPAVDDMAVNGSEKGKEAAKGAGSDDAADREVDFSESFVLVPNWDLVLAKNPPRGLKPWLILTQNYRAL